MGFCKSSEAEKRTIANGVELELMAHNEDMFAILNKVPKGVTKAPHSHPAVQIYLITEGKMEITIGEETAILVAGDSAIVPSGVVHIAKALEDSVEIEFFNDPRKDVLDKYF